MIPKPLAGVTEADLLALISNGVMEGKMIEFKRELPGGQDADKKEFLGDVSSFANTTGGDLLFGVEAVQGVATQLVGLANGDLDKELQRLDALIADGLDPRIRYAHAIVPLTGNKPVLVFRIERSWIAPHRVVYKGHDKFYGRSATRKYPSTSGNYGRHLPCPRQFQNAYGLFGLIVLSR
jgi:predicted HTH transcriptional regulator